MTDDASLEQKLRERLTRSPFVRSLELDLLSIDTARQELRMRAKMRPEFERTPNSGQWHGGPIAAFIDTAGDYALIMLSGRAPPTVNLRVDYLRPAIDTDLTAEARVRRAGKSIGFVDIDVLNDSGVVVAIGRANYLTNAR